MVTAQAPSKIHSGTNGPWPFTLRTFRRKRWSAAWPRWPRSRRTKMTSKAYKPEGYQSVIPYLHVNGAAKMIAFMKEVFDAKEIAVYPRPDGTIGHAALRIGDSVVELADG